MSPEELDEARAKEAYREAAKLHRRGTPAVIDVAIRAARLGREAADARIKNLEAKVAELEGALPLPQHGVDPDILAFREWAAKEWPIASEAASAGHMDTTRYAQAYLAGARMAREQERERAKVLVEYVWDDAKRPDGAGDRARKVLAKYEGTL